MQTPTAARPPRLWAAIAAAALLDLPLGSLYAFSVLLKPLETLLALTRTELAIVFGMASITFTIGLNLAPRLLRYLQPPLLIGLSGAISGTGIGLAAIAEGFAELALGYGILFGIGGGVAFMVVQQGVNLMATRWQGLINGYLVALLPAGAMLSTLAFGWGLANIGVRATIGGLAVVIGTTGLLAMLLAAIAGMRSPPAVAPGEAAAALPGRRLVFWQLFTVFFLAAAAGLTVLSQAAGIVIAYGGATATALVATTAMTGAIAVARLTGGWLTDRLPFPVVMAGAQLFALAGPVAMTLRPSSEAAIIGLGMVGMGYGFISGATAGAVAFYWPKADYGRIASRLYIAWCIAAITLPVLAGHLYDLSGGYATAMLIAGAGNLVAALVALSLPRRV